MQIKRQEIPFSAYIAAKVACTSGRLFEIEPESLYRIVSAPERLSAAQQRVARDAEDCEVSTIH